MPSRWPTRASPLTVIQRQLGHSNLGVTSIYLQGIDNAEIIAPGLTPIAATR
jgi:integrase